LDRIADVSQKQSDELNSLSKAIDELFVVVKKALRSIGATVVKAELRHYGEIVEVHFDSPPQVVKLLGGSSTFRNCSREQALRTLVEDPDEVVQAVAVVGRNGTKLGRVARQKRLLDDSDEEIEIPKSAIPKIDNGEMSVSIDAIKRAYACPVHDSQGVRKGEIADENVVDSSKQSTLTTSFQWSIQLSPEEPAELIFGIIPPIKQRLRFKVLNPYQCRLSPTLPMPQGYTSYVLISIEVTKAQQSTASLTISVDWLFDEIISTLWQSPGVVSKTVDKSYLRLWIPKTLQVEDQTHHRGANEYCTIIMAEKIYSVSCEDSNIILDFFDNLSDFCVENGPNDFTARLVSCSHT
jgi:hypothetical protein